MTRPVPPPTPGNRLLERRLADATKQERSQGLARSCPALEERERLRYTLGDRRVLSFCSNDYLGLASHSSAPLQAASGAAASRLVCGDLPRHRELEARFAEWVGTEDAVLFPSGFQANVGLPSALIQARDHVYSDALNHASSIDGLRLSAAPRTILPHLERPELGPGKLGYDEALAWWFCESVFSMDGDGPGLVELEAHLAQGGCLVLDEAHAIGLYAGGRGRAARLTRKPTVIVAPLGKAFGCAGAMACASRRVCAWIRSHARAFVFTTGVSPVLVERIAAALELVRGAEGERRREVLWRNVSRLRARLEDCLGPAKALASPILPVVVGSNERALHLSARLLDRGWHVQAIRPPTVPRDRARLRITVSAEHEAEQIDAFARDLTQLLAESSIQPNEGPQ